MTLKYKVGDRVRILESGWGCGSTHVGMYGVIQEVPLTPSKNYVILMDDGSSLYEMWEQGFELAEDLQTSNESGYTARKIGVLNDVVSSAVSDTQPKAQDNSWYENGELPPVGTICETWFDDGKVCWHRCEVLKHHHNDNKYAAVHLLDGEHEDKLIWEMSLRPWYSDEDIEAQEREKVVEKMLDIVKKSSVLFDVERVKMQALYDAGLRFVEEE